MTNKTSKRKQEPFLRINPENKTRLLQLIGQRPGHQSIQERIKTILNDADLAPLREEVLKQQKEKLEKLTGVYDALAVDLAFLKVQHKKHIKYSFSLGLFVGVFLTGLIRLAF